MLEVTVLGCGSSLGVPMLGCKCAVCKSASAYNKRRRSAIFIKSSQANVLVDFGFEIREQLIGANIEHIDAAILTHAHSDHMSGIDNLKAFFFVSQKPVTIYTEYATAQVLMQKYSYLFNEAHLIIKPIDFYSEIHIKDLKIQFFQQFHGAINSLGMRIKDFVYSNDVMQFPRRSESFLTNIDTWVLDCMAYKATKTHFGLDNVLQLVEKYRPKNVLLTNLSHAIDYHEIMQRLPQNIKPLYDSMRFIVN